VHVSVMLNVMLQCSLLGLAVHLSPLTCGSGVLAFLGYDNLQKLVKDKLVTGINIDKANLKQQLHVHDTCVEGQHARSPFPESKTVCKNSLELLLHMDLCGPFQEESLGGSLYVATFLDDFSKLSVVGTLAHKSDVTSAVQEVIAMLETHTGNS
jgi:hypothetical protein